ASLPCICPLFAKFRRPLASVDTLWQCVLAHKIDAIIAQGGWSHKPGLSFNKALLVFRAGFLTKGVPIDIVEIRMIDIPAEIRKLWRNAYLGVKLQDFVVDSIFVVQTLWRSCDAY